MVAPLALVGGAASAPPSAAAGSAPAPVVAERGAATAWPDLTGTLAQPVVDIAAHPKQQGYWLAAADGGVFGHGAARFYGSAGNLHLNAPVVAIAATPSGNGYWLTASDGGIFTYGDARFFGSTGAIHLWSPIVAMSATPSGQGYWLAAADGGVFTFGDAHFFGSAALLPTGGVVDFAPSRSGQGYAILTADGTIYRFGDATAAPAHPTFGQPAAAFTASPDGKGYTIVSRDGHVYTTGTAKSYGSSVIASMTAIGIARTPNGDGYWIPQVPAGPPLPPGSGSGQRIVYSNAQQRVWLVEANGVVSHSWLVSGRTGTPPLGTYHILSRSAITYVGSLSLNHMQRFYLTANGGWIGFHAIPRNPDGSPIEADSQLGTPMSHGCIRMTEAEASLLWDWAGLGTTVVAVA